MRSTLALLTTTTLLGEGAAGGALRGSTAQASASYNLHEWGTFTTVSGSNGVLLSGLEREEEALPSFVYSHAGMQNAAEPSTAAGSIPVLKGFYERSLLNVKVKMETPVVYFHDVESPIAIDLRVGFRGGSISQWYPQRSEGETPPHVNVSRLLDADAAAPLAASEGAIDFAHPGAYEGWIRWGIDVLPRASVDPVKLFHGGETVGWMHPKVQRAAVVRNAQGEHDDYLFYRGVGNFEQPVTFSVGADEALTIKNESPDRVPFAFVFENLGGGSVRYALLPEGVGGGAAVTVAEADLTSVHAPAAWKEAVYVPLRDGLAAAGLYGEEADGMVRTWWKSYFEAEGLRVFWVVPSAFTARVLPMEVQPPPAAAVRVIVGRSEVLRPRFEAQMSTAFTEGAEQAAVLASDRFGLAYAERHAAMLAEHVQLA
jgi:hypothetical protein